MRKRFKFLTQRVFETAIIAVMLIPSLDTSSRGGGDVVSPAGGVGGTSSGGSALATVVQIVQQIILTSASNPNLSLNLEGQIRPMSNLSAGTIPTNAFVVQGVSPKVLAFLERARQAGIEGIASTEIGNKEAAEQNGISQHFSILIHLSKSLESFGMADIQQMSSETLNGIAKTIWEKHRTSGEKELLSAPDVNDYQLAVKFSVASREVASRSDMPQEWQFHPAQGTALHMTQDELPVLILKNDQLKKYDIELAKAILRDREQIAPQLWRSAFAWFIDSMRRMVFPLAHGTQTGYLESILSKGLGGVMPENAFSPEAISMADVNKPGGLIVAFAFATRNRTNLLSVDSKQKTGRDVIDRYGSVNPFFKPWWKRFLLRRIARRFEKMRGPMDGVPLLLIYDYYSPPERGRYPSQANPNEVHFKTPISTSYLRIALVPAKQVAEIYNKLYEQGISSVRVLPLELLELEEIYKNGLVDWIFPTYKNRK